MVQDVSFDNVCQFGAILADLVQKSALGGRLILLPNQLMQG